MHIFKIGGGNDLNIPAFLDDIASLNQPCILIHGGAEELNEVAEKLGHPPRMVTSISGIESRYTDRETLEIFEMVYCGKRNKMIVEGLQQRGINAIGLSGIDGRLLEGRRKPAIKVIENGKKKVLRGDFTGKIEKVNTDLLHLLLNTGYMPVITPPAISYESEAINTDGDRAAAMIASSLEAETLIIFSNIPGLLRDKDDETSLIRNIKLSEIETAMECAKGRMKKKVMGAKEALVRGVKKVIFADARGEHPIRNALAGNGTVIE